MTPPEQSWQHFDRVPLACDKDEERRRLAWFPISAGE
jgi:hypothetical protein